MSVDLGWLEQPLGRSMHLRPADALDACGRESDKEIRGLMDPWSEMERAYGAAKLRMLRKRETKVKTGMVSGDWLPADIEASFV